MSYYDASISWGSSSDTELVAIVAAADRGELDLYHDAGWRVGDEREIHCSALPASYHLEAHAAQTITLVLLQRCIDLKYPSVGHWMVGMKDNLLEPGILYSPWNVYGIWKYSARRAWCNTTFYHALPATLRPIFKRHPVYTVAGYRKGYLLCTQDYFHPLAATEIHGPTSTLQVHAVEQTLLTQYAYYADPAHRIHRTAWWTRSPHNIYNDICNIVYIDGTIDGHYATQRYGWTLCGCV